jgi:arabinofuranosyltransferase
MRRTGYNFLIALFLCSLAALFTLSKFNYQLTGIDDANIYLVYARNVANGHGFVFNVGGERVEGFTSILWTLICAFAFRLSNHPEQILLIINIIMISAGIAITLTYLQDEFRGPQATQPAKLLWASIFLILLVTSPRYIVWNTITLMENGLWSTLLLITTIFVIKDHSSSREINLGFIPLLILLVMTRPESMFWGSIFIAILFIRLVFVKSPMAALMDLEPSILCFMICVSLMILFQFQYFGYLLPNTYYAKVSPSLVYDIQQGGIYLSKYIISDPIVLISVIAITVSGWSSIAGIFSKKIPKDSSIYLPMIAGAGLLEPLIIGGDHFGAFRIYQNIYPIEILCLLYFMSRIFPIYIRTKEFTKAVQWRSKAFRFGPTLLLILVFVPSQISLWGSVKSEIGVEFQVADYGRKSGLVIQQLFSTLPKLPSLGVVTSGGIKYSYAGEIVDLMGLNNTIMAHNHGDRKGIKDHAAFDITTFYKLQPDILWPRTVIEKGWTYNESEIKESWENREGLKGLFDQPQFLEMYTFAKVTSEPQSGYALVGWFKNELLDQLNARAEFQVEEYQYMP